MRAQLTMRFSLLALATAFALIAAPSDARAQSCPGAASELKINEVNAGEGGPAPEDVGTFIEIRHACQTTPSGNTFDLTGWKLTNGDGSITVDLAGTMSVDGASFGLGYWVVCSDAGPPVANCDQMDSNLAALAAESTLRLLDPAGGLEDDAVFPDPEPADPVTRSHVTTSRTPDGLDNGGDGPSFQLSCPTPGATNHQGFEDPLSFCGVVINEVDYDQGTSDTTGFIELSAYDERDISCWKVFISDPAGVERMITLPEEITILATGDHYVLCEDPATTPNCDQSFTVPPDPACASEDVLAAIGDTGKHGIKLVGSFSREGETVLDSMSYLDLVDGYTEGPVEAPSDLDTDVAALSVSRLPNNADKDVNETDFGLACATPGADNVADLSCACGTGTLEGDEECDDGNDDNTDDCVAGCVEATCGDGFVQDGVEDCDVEQNTESCDVDCTAPACGDGVWNAMAGEQCDPTDSASVDCNDDCTLSAFARGSGGCTDIGGGASDIAFIFGILALLAFLRRRSALRG